MDRLIDYRRLALPNRLPRRSWISIFAGSVLERFQVKHAAADSANRIAARLPLSRPRQKQKTAGFPEDGESHSSEIDMTGMGFGLTLRRSPRQNCRKVDTPAACALRGW
jgi:hypothetical protein